MFVVDDWGFNDAGYQSTYMNWTTPNIDKLANGGIKLSNYYTHESCVPSRAALLTGRYALRFGMHGESNERIELPLTEVTLADELKSAGYRTNHVGKWHMGYSTLDKTPFYRGFDYSYGYYNAEMDYWTKMVGSNLDLHENGAMVTSAAEKDSSLHSEILFTDKAIQAIEDHAANYADQPMFLYFASQLIHTPWEAPDEYKLRCAAVNPSATLDQQSYCALNLLLDAMVGKLSCALDENGMSDNTLFVMVSDNGGVTAMDGNNYPYRGAKFSAYSGGNHVASFVYGSESIIPKSRQGGVYEGQVHVTDWLPTFMGLATNGEWAGGSTGNTIDGADQWTSIISNGETSHPDMVLYLDSDLSVTLQSHMVRLMQIQSANYVGLPNFAYPNKVFSASAEEDDTTACLFASSESSMRSKTHEQSTLNLVAEAVTKTNYALVVMFLLAMCLLGYQLLVSSSVLSSLSKRIAMYTSQSSEYSYQQAGVSSGDVYSYDSEASPLVRK
eukprot:gene35511-43782_t